MLISTDDLPSESMSHQLHSVTDSKNWNAQIEYFSFNRRSTIKMYAVRTARQDYGRGFKGLNLFESASTGPNLRINFVFSNPSSNKLRVLRAKIDYEYAVHKRARSMG